MKYEFRGLDPKTNKWIYGYHTSADTINDKRVKVNSIGMWSGRRDSKGRKIYENDIVKVTTSIGSSYYKVTFTLQNGFHLSAGYVSTKEEQEDEDLGIEISIIGYDEEVEKDNDGTIDFSSDNRENCVWSNFNFRT